MRHLPDSEAFPSRLAQLRANLRWGITGGLFFATGLCFLAAIPGIFLLLLGVVSYFAEQGGGSDFWVPGTSKAAIHSLEIFPLYFLAGILGGVLVGLLRPLARWRLGATVLGMMAGTILYWCAGFAAAALTDLRPLSAEHFWTSLGLGSIVGGYATFKEWKP